VARDVEQLFAHIYDADDTVKDIAQSVLLDLLSHLACADLKW
jgi:hypothetical protein